MVERRVVKSDRKFDDTGGSVRSVAVLRMNCAAVLAGHALGRQTQGPQ